MRKILDQMEQLRRLTESPVHRLMEQQKLLRNLADPLSNNLVELQKTFNIAQEAVNSPIRQIIEQQKKFQELADPLSRHMEALSPTINEITSNLADPLSSSITELQKTANIVQDAVNDQIHQTIEQQKRFQELAAPLSRQMEALSPRINELAKISSLAEHTLPTLSSLADQFTVVDPVMREMKRYQSLISAIENPAAEWFRNQNRWKELCHDIELAQTELIEPVRIPFPQSEPKRERSAELFCKQLIEQIQNVEAQLQDDECVIIYCYTEAGEIIFIQRIAYQNPDMIVLFGFTEGRDHRILAHMETVQLHVRVEKNPESEEGKSRWIQ